MIHQLTKTKTWIKQDVRSGNPCTESHLHTSLKKAHDFADHVRILW